MASLKYPPLKIISKPGCHRCESLEKLLTDAGIEFSVREADPLQPGSFPQIFYGTLMVRPEDRAYFLEGLKMRMFTASTVFKPFSYPWAVELRKLHEKIHWVEQEISLQDDVTDWKSGRLSEDEKSFISYILKLFTQLDVEVGQLFYDKFIPVFRNNEIRNMLGSFACREGTHQMAYSLLNDTLGLPESDYGAFVEYVEMSEKLDFMRDMDIRDLESLVRALVKAVFNEGVLLFAAFMMLLNFQRFGLMKGMGKVVEWSIRDENVHVEGACTLLRTVLKEYPFLRNDALLNHMVETADSVRRLEKTFIDAAFDGFHIRGLDRDTSLSYIDYILSKRIQQAGFSVSIAGVPGKNPVPWIEWIVDGKDLTNFFENTVTEYEIGGLTGNWSYQRIVIQTRGRRTSEEEQTPEKEPTSEEESACEEASLEQRLLVRRRDEEECDRCDSLDWIR